MMKARIFEIKRFAVHDGDGIRTTVFFKGCPLRCLWCHNPEGIGFAPELACYPEKCLGCGECAQVCTHNAHRITDAGHSFDRDACVACGDCQPACLGQALRFYGKEMSVDEVLDCLLEDREFYENSGGGVTLSGGECLMQADFCEALLRRCKENGLHTAVDTCGFVSRETLERVLPFTDVFLYDLKAVDEQTHVRCTGQSNRLILENLRYLDAMGKTVEIRIPYVPGYNADQIPAMAELLSGLSCVSRVRVLPYHNYAGSKYASLHMENTLPALLPGTDEVAEAVALLRSYGLRAD